jgi:type IV secretory pathway TrbL component
MSDAKTIRSNLEGAGAQAGQAAQQAASSALGKAQDMASNAGKRVEEATSALGERVQSMAGSLRDRGPHEGMLGTATGRVADSLDTAGRYLQDEGIAGMAEDVTEIIRRNPIPAVVVGIGFGFLLARLFRS